MRDVVQVLSRWGAWARENNTCVGWSPTAAGFGRLLPSEGRTPLSCCDDDGLLIDSCVCKLKSERVHRPDELNCIMLYYVWGKSKRSISRLTGMDEKQVREHMQVAEGFIAGCLAWLPVGLEMDIEVS